jgi:tripartite-type tricarboxylate transporter receptor subunit TctC
VRLVVPYAAGGAVDLVARHLAPALAEALGQPFIIDNRGGSTGMIGTETVARAAPDGHTLLLTAYPPHNVYRLFYRSVPFDAINDFTVIAPIVTVPQAVIVNPSLGVSSIGELIDYAKKNPGKLSYATSGVGTTSHVGMELLNQAAGIDMLHIPYKGGAPALTDVLGGAVPVGCVVLSNVLPYARSGRLRLLAVLQAGVSGYDVPDLLFAMVGPAHLPPAIVARMNLEATKASASPEVRAKLEAGGYEIAAATPREFAETVIRHTEVYHKFALDAGVKPE